MKKKISLIICMLAAVLCFTACGSSASQEKAYDEAQLAQVEDFIINYCASADDATFEQWYSTSEFSADLQLTQAGLPMSGEDFVASLKGWQAGVKECGAYISHDAFSYKVRNGKIEATAPAQFEKRNGTITLMFNRESNLESLTVSADMSIGEILEKAGMNTLLGMGTVFSVLILIAFIISLLKYIPKIIEGFSKKEKAQEEQTQTPVAAAPAVEETPEAANDAELIAVIAAAIAAAEGTSTDGFVVRNIRRRPSNKWNSK